MLPAAIPAAIPPAAPLSPTPPVHADAFAARAQPDNPSMGDRVTSAMEGFQKRAAHMQEQARQAAAPPAAGVNAAQSPTGFGAPPPGSVQAVQPVGVPPANGAAGSPNVFGLMLDSFNFAIETQLVARAATQFTGSINTLMKGQ